MSRGDERQQKSLEWQFLSRGRTDIAEKVRRHVTPILQAAGWMAAWYKFRAWTFFHRKSLCIAC